MKHYAPRSRAPRTPTKQIPPFHAVQVRARADGWTPVRQAEFIGVLAQTRSVAAAARGVSMAREGAYQLRARALRDDSAAGFVAAWDAAAAPMGHGEGAARYVAACDRARLAVKASRKVTLAALQWRIDTGVWHVILRGGRYAGVRRKPDNLALLAVLGRTGTGPEVRYA